MSISNWLMSDCLVIFETPSINTLINEVASFSVRINSSSWKVSLNIGSTLKSEEIIEEISLDEELTNKLGDEIEAVIESIHNEKDWGSFGPELLFILTSILTQTAIGMGMDKDNFHEFVSQFFEPESEEEQEQENMEMYSINTRVKNNGELNWNIRT